MRAAPFLLLLVVVCAARAVSASRPRLHAAFCVSGICDRVRLRLVVATAAEATAISGGFHDADGDAAATLASGLSVLISNPAGGGNATTGGVFLNDSALVRMAVHSRALIPPTRLRHISASFYYCMIYIYDILVVK